ncbi:MAG: ABC transporter substrate-binding protein [Planctomycetota bacterium]|jgi:peptide/nickel transport system substrate-binding protein
MRILALLFAALVVVPVCGACGGDSKNGGKLRGPVFLWGKSGDAIKLDPADVTDGESVMVVTNIFDNLVTFKDGSTELKPWLAERWESSEDAKVWTFFLRKDVKFHDGTNVDAGAVKFSFDRQMQEDHPARRSDSVFSYFELFGALQKVEAVDQYTVRFTLAEPVGFFDAMLAMFCVAIISPTAYASEGKDADGRYNYDFSQNPVGSGPFRFVEWKKDEYIKLAANPDHFAGEPEIGTLIFKPVKEAQPRLKELEAGALTGMDNPHLVDVKRMRDSGTKLQVLRSPGINVCYLAMNTQKKPYTDKRVRQAVAYAINKKRLIEAAYAGIGDPAVSMCPQSLKGHLAMEDRKPDLAKAKQLLAEAGYPNGFETEFWYPVIQRAYLPDSSATAIQIAQDLKAIGIKANLKKVEWTPYLAGTSNGSHELCIMGWMADFGDPDNFLFTLLDKSNAVPPKANNRSFYMSEKYSDLVTRARYTVGWDKRKELYAQAQRVVFEDAPVIPLVTVPDFRVLAPNVTGYTIFPAGGEYFRGVGFKK